MGQHPRSSSLAFVSMGAGASSIDMQKKGPFLVVKDDDGQIQRVVRETGDKIPIKRLFVKLEDITSVTQKNDENDVILTLRNGVEYCLDSLDEPGEVWSAICDKIVQDEDD